MSFNVTFGKAQNHSAARALVAGGICLGLSAMGFFVAFAGERLGGGIPHIPDALNQSIGRVAFGLGAVVTGAIGVYAFYDAWRLRPWFRRETSPPP
jgi:hypothetical protein